LSDQKHLLELNTDVEWDIALFYETPLGPHDMGSTIRASNLLADRSVPQQA